MHKNQNPLMSNASGNESEKLAQFAAALTYNDIPKAVVDRTVDLFVDWTGSALSGKGHKAAPQPCLQHW